MHRSMALLLLSALTLAAQGRVAALFNGKDLAGWRTVSGHWVVRGGALHLEDSTDGREHDDGYLWTQEAFGDFILDLEFKIDDPANSGVFIRTEDPKNPVQTGLEIQVMSMNPGEPLRKNSVGSIYDLAAPKENRYKPGEWNRYRITCKGPKISVALNGVVVSEVDLDQFTEAHKSPDGSKNKFNRPLKEFGRKGYIGLQDHGRPVSYRNIRIQRLD